MPPPTTRKSNSSAREVRAWDCHLGSVMKSPLSLPPPPSGRLCTSAMRSQHGKHSRANSFLLQTMQDPANQAEIWDRTQEAGPGSLAQVTTNSGTLAWSHATAQVPQGQASSPTPIWITGRVRNPRGREDRRRESRVCVRE